MFVIRQAKPTDNATLLKLAKMVYFINLPPNEQIIAAKIEQSHKAFLRAAGVSDGATSSTAKAALKRKRSGTQGLASMDEDSDLFVFSMLDTDLQGVIGTSQVRSHQGGPGNPNWSMQITEKQFRSEPLSYSSTHKVGRLYGDESGPTEVGGLIIQPSYRGHEKRPGRFLSFVRFHFIGMYRRFFADRILAEMMAPVSNEGENVFWDHFGRKFIPVKYAEADRFCQHNRKFIPELLPREEIYFSLFPLEVQNMVGVVSKETIPARRLLESMGFKYRGFIDPFDGGPHLDAPTDGVDLVKSTKAVKLGEPMPAAKSSKLDKHGIVSVLSPEGEFRALETNFAIEKNAVRLAEAEFEALEASAGAVAGYTLVAPPDVAPAVAAEQASRRSAKSSKATKPSKSNKRAKAASA
ncbi:MAG TPA: arginine N-succinyltransferase [Phycisphaerales bacterium]